MSDYSFLRNQERNKTFILVEGDKEKEELIKIYLELFSDFPIVINSVEIYSTNIYDLYDYIEAEYDADWFEIEASVDIPFLYSKKKQLEEKLNKNNYTNIILIFDYDPQEPRYTDEKIRKLQNHFNNISDDGILYINYPMIEAYKHIKSIPDEEFFTRNVALNGLTGKDYKRLVSEETCFDRLLALYELIKKELKSGYFMSQKQRREAIALLYKTVGTDNVDGIVSEALKETNLSQKELKTKYHKLSAIMKTNVFEESESSLYDRVQLFLVYAVKITIQKANAIQNNNIVSEMSIKEMFYQLNMADVLEAQIKSASRFPSPYINVLALSLTFWGEYKALWSLLDDMQQDNGAVVEGYPLYP